MVAAGSEVVLKKMGRPYNHRTLVSELKWQPLRMPLRMSGSCPGCTGVTPVAPTRNGNQWTPASSFKYP